MKDREDFDDKYDRRFDEYHDNNPRCTRCRDIIIGKVENVYGMPYDVKCYRIVVAEISKDGP